MLGQEQGVRDGGTIPITCDATSVDTMATFTGIVQKLLLVEVMLGRIVTEEIEGAAAAATVAIGTATVTTGEDSPSGHPRGGTATTTGGGGEPTEAGGTAIEDWMVLGFFGKFC